MSNIVNIRRLAAAALIQYPSILQEFKLERKHFGHQKALYALVEAIPSVPDRDPMGGVPEAHLAALAAVEDHIVTELVKRRFHSQDAARESVRRLVNAVTEEEARAKLRYLSEGAADLREGIREVSTMLSTVDSESVVTLGDLLQQELSVIEGGKEDEGLIKSGIPSLDKAIKGFLPGELILIASDSGSGKTTLALYVMRELARKGIHSVFFSGEMSDSQMRKKISHAESGIRMTERLDVESLRSAIESSDGSLCHFDFRSIASPERITSTIRSLQERHGLGIAFFDHLRHIDAGGSKDNQYMRMSKTVAAAKRIALDNKIPFVVLTHFSRTHTEHKRPNKEMIRDSGQIGEDADTIICPWRPPGHLHTELWVLKARMTGEQDIKVCDLVFDPAHQAFAELDEWREEPEHQGAEPRDLSDWS